MSGRLHARVKCKSTSSSRLEHFREGLPQKWRQAFTVTCSTSTVANSSLKVVVEDQVIVMRARASWARPPWGCFQLLALQSPSPGSVVW